MNVGVFSRGYISGQYQVYTSNTFVPYAYAQGGVQYMKVATPSSSGRLFVREYSVQSLTEIIQRDGRVVGQIPRTLISDQPTDIYEVDYASGYFVPNISEIRVKRNTFTWDDIARRTKKLGFVLDQSDYMLLMDGEWDVWKPVKQGCLPAIRTAYKPRAFRRVPRREDNPVDSPITENRYSVQSSTDSTDTYQYESTNPNTSDTFDLPRVEQQASPIPDTQQPSTSTSPAGGNESNSKVSNILYVSPGQEFQMNGKWYHSAKGTYMIYNPTTGIWRNYERAPDNVDKSGIQDYNESTRQSTENYYSQPSGGSNSSDAVNAPVYGNTSSSTISWESGQSSQTVTTSTGVHTIYR